MYYYYPGAERRRLKSRLYGNGKRNIVSGCLAGSCLSWGKKICTIRGTTGAVYLSYFVILIIYSIEKVQKLLYTESKIIVLIPLATYSICFPGPGRIISARYLIDRGLACSATACREILNLDGDSVAGTGVSECILLYRLTD